MAVKRPRRPRSHARLSGLRIPRTVIQPRTPDHPPVGPEGAARVQATEAPPTAPEGSEAEAGRPPTVEVLPAVLPAEDTQAVKQPMYSTRGTEPGLRGCWAVSKAGSPCAAPRRGDSEYCNSHSGYGVAEDPAKWGQIGATKYGEIRRRRATLRLALGQVRLNTPRGVLRASAFAQAEAIAAAALSPISDPAASSMQRHSAALALLREVEPQAQLEVSTPLPATPEGVRELSLSALLSIAEEHGIPLPNAAPALVEGSDEG
jgi:hypothetical protein